MPLIRLFFEICFFRKGPQDVPASGFLLGLTICISLLFSILLGLLEVSLAQAILQAVCSSLFLLLFVFLTLSLMGRGARFMQTASAAMGGDGLITALAIPLVLARSLSPEAESLSGTLFYALMIWEMAVIGHVIRLALGLPFLAGVALALGYMMVSLRAMIQLFPPLT